METVILVMDESGAKGYDNNQEQEPGEFGVMAGFALPESSAEPFTSRLSEIVRLFRTDGKLHITELSPSDQERLRQRLFNYFIECKVLWFYKAIYVQGYHAAHGQIRRNSEEARRARRSNVKLSLNSTKKSLHGELFLGAFTSGLALAVDHIGSECHLKIVTDRVDEPILKLFETEADRFLDAGKPRRKEVTGFDTAKKEVLRGAIETSIVSGIDAIGDFSGTTYEIVCADDVLTLAADILANSVRYHLSQIQVATPGAPLNSPEAISGHPLQHLVYGTSTGGVLVNVADTIFGHPNSCQDVVVDDG